LRLHGSVGGPKTAIGAEIGYEVSGGAPAKSFKWTGTLDLDDAKTAMNALSTLLVVEIKKASPAFKDVTTTIGAKILETANYITQATGVATSMLYWAPGKCVNEACPYTRKGLWPWGKFDCFFLCPSGHAGGMWDGGVPNVACADRGYFAYRDACLPDYPWTKKPEYPSEWPQNLKPKFDALITAAWGGRRMRKFDFDTENAKLYESIRRITAANVVEEWTVGQSLPVGTANTTTNTAETPDF